MAPLEEPERPRCAAVFSLCGTDVPMHCMGHLSHRFGHRVPVQLKLQVIHYEA